MLISKDIQYIGVFDQEIDLFEGLYPVPDGVSYNSYVILDEKIAVMDTVDAHFSQTWLNNLQAVLKDRQPDFLIIHHMEPDHSASIRLLMDAYPDVIIVSSAKAFPMMKAFFGDDYPTRRMIIKDGDQLCLGRHKLSFLAAPMVHWPEVIMTWDQTEGVLFSADAFGSFGPLDEASDWSAEAARYYFGIVGKYGAQVQAVLKKMHTPDIRRICPLHGPALEGPAITDALRLYDLWSSYQAERSGVVIAHASVYGNTRAAAEKLADNLRSAGIHVVVHDLNRCDLSQAISDAFRFDRLVLAASTYNAGVFPPMRSFLHGLTERGYGHRTIGLIENGSWAPMAAKVMREMLDVCKELVFPEPIVTIRSALNEDSEAQLASLSQALTH